MADYTKSFQPTGQGWKTLLWRSYPAPEARRAGLQDWLTDSASLTARIRSRCRSFTVRVIRQRRCRPLRDEWQMLGRNQSASAWVREVLLCADGEAVVFARSLLLPGRSAVLCRLFHAAGEQPLGRALFSHANIHRGILYSGFVDWRDTRYHDALRQANPPLPARLWGRCSVFSLTGHRPGLLVSEFFLPAIMKLPS